MPLLRLIAAMLVTSSSGMGLGMDAALAQLDKAECNKLAVQREKLLTREIRDALARGPDWVKEHLDTDKIEQVREYLQVEEKSLFLCRKGGVVVPREVMPLPDRNPAPPAVRAASSMPAATAAAAAATDGGMPLPDRKPDRDAPSSQTMADSDKTAPTQSKATP